LAWVLKVARVKHYDFSLCVSYVHFIKTSKTEVVKNDENMNTIPVFYVVVFINGQKNIFAPHKNDFR